MEARCAPAPDLRDLLRPHRSHWLPVLEAWLAQYHGLERHLSCLGEHPRVQLAQALAQHQDEEDAALASRLARLDFLCWRVKHANGERWRPLEETFRDFEARGQVFCWQWDTELPAPDETASWLLSRLRAVEPPPQ